jgi:hypothetical protein
VQQPVHGEQLLVVAGGADDSDDVGPRPVPPVERGAGAVVHADRVHAGVVTDDIDTVDGPDRGRRGRRLQEEPVTDPLTHDRTLDAAGLTQGHPQGPLEQRDPGRPVQHLGHAASDAPVDLDQTGTGGRELHLRV